MSDVKCPECGSRDVWDDNLYGGCDNCKAQWEGFTIVSKSTGRTVGHIDGNGNGGFRKERTYREIMEQDPSAIN